MNANRLWSVIVAIMTVLCLGSACGHGSGTNDRISRASGAGNFTNGRNAAGALATISQRLIARGRQCTAQHGDGAVECQTLGVASAWSQVAAVDVARCGRADAVEARRTVLGLLHDVDQ